MAASPLGPHYSSKRSSRLRWIVGAGIVAGVGLLTLAMSSRTELSDAAKNMAASLHLSVSPPQSAEEVATYLQRSGLSIESVTNVPFRDTGFPATLIRFEGFADAHNEQARRASSEDPDEVIAGFFGVVIVHGWVKSVWIVECPRPEIAEAVVAVDLKERSFKEYVGFAYGRFAILGDREWVARVKTALP